MEHLNEKADKLKAEIKKTANYSQRRIITWDKTHKDTYVITGRQCGEHVGIYYIGKVVQVRLEAGEFGSNIVFLRHADGLLQTHDNQTFYTIPEKYLKKVEELFEEGHPGGEADDADAQEYFIHSAKPEKGFIIASKIPEGETTPMRTVKKALNQVFKDMTDCLGD